MIPYMNYKYPVEETCQESYERFMTLYSLTMKANEIDLNTQPSIRLLEVWWARIADIWENETYLKHGVRIFDEVLYHICRKVFSPKLENPLLMRLVLLVEDELGRCGYAFRVWSRLREFGGALYRTLYPKRGDLTWISFHSSWFLNYLKGHLRKYVELKGRGPEEWEKIPHCDEDLLYLSASNCYDNNIEDFEIAIQFLIPDTYGWIEEWRDIGIILDRLKQLYSIDFTADPEGFDHLIHILLHTNDIGYMAYHLYRMKNMTPALAQHIWGDDVDDMIMRCFTDIYQRYKRAKKNKVRSCYSQKALMESWLYKQIEEWYGNQSQKLTDKVRKAYFNIALGVR